MFDPNPQIKERKQRWCNFYDFSQPASQVFIIRYAPDLPPRPVPNPELKRERIEWSWKNYEYHLQRMQWLEDDNIPCLDMLTGTELFAEAFGCRVYRSEEDMPFALPLVSSAAEADKLAVPSLEGSPVGIGFRNGR